MNASEIVRVIMDRYGITNPQLSKTLGLSRGYVYRKLVQDNMGTAVFARICDALDCDVLVRDRHDGAEFFLSPKE